MAIYNRERDFTSITLDDIRENLRGETTEYKEFAKFTNEYGNAFETVDLPGALLPLDRHMTEVRLFMSELAPRELGKIETEVFSIDQNYAAQCREISAELKAFNSTIHNLTQVIDSENFVAILSSPISLSYYNDAVIEGVKYVVLDPALWQFINSLLLAAGMAPLADGPLLFGDVVAILLLLAIAGVLAVAAFVSLCQWIYSMATDKGKTKAKPETAPKSPKKIKGNKEANKVAKELGYEGKNAAEDFKEEWVPGSGNEFDMYRDTATGKIWLKHHDTGNWVETYLFYWPDEDSEDPFES